MPERETKTLKAPVFWTILEICWRDPNDLLSRLITMDETRLYHYYPETKQQSMEWRHCGSPRPKNSECKNPLEMFSPDILGSRRHPSNWLSSKRANYQRGVLLIPAGEIEGCFEKKRRGKFTKWVLFLHDNVPAHRAFATQKKLAYLGFQSLDNSPYSPDVAPSDYNLFPGLKKIERSPFFFRRGRNCCRGDLVGRTKFWICFEWLTKVRGTV